MGLKKGTEMIYNFVSQETPSNILLSIFPILFLCTHSGFSDTVTESELDMLFYTS